jgi:hypothetical protein
MITTGTQTIELITSTTAEIDVMVSALAFTSSSVTPVTQDAQISTATTTTILDIPGNFSSATQLQIKCISLCNNGTAANTITVQKNAGTIIRLYKTVLQAGQSAVYSVDGGWQRFDSNGTPVTEPASKLGIQTGYSNFFMKTGTAPEATGVPYLFAKDAGLPGAFTVSSAGLTGEAWSDAKAGGIPITINSGTLYLSALSVTASLAGVVGLLDILWMNSGIAIATTTAQSITPATAAARDNQGTSNGNGVIPALYVSSSTGNGAAITNTTISYTSQDGTPGKTGTMPSFPQTCQTGSLVFFNLAAGDTGCRSIQSITLGTTYASGTIHLVLVRPIVQGPVLLANTGYCTSTSDYKSVKIFPNSFLTPWFIPTAATATNITGIANFVEV